MCPEVVLGVLLVLAGLCAVIVEVVCLWSTGRPIDETVPYVDCAWRGSVRLGPLGVGVGLRWCVFRPLDRGRVVDVRKSFGRRYKCIACCSLAVSGKASYHNQPEHDHAAVYLFPAWESWRWAEWAQLGGRGREAVGTCCGTSSVVTDQMGGYIIDLPLPASHAMPTTHAGPGWMLLLGVGVVAAADGGFCNRMRRRGRVSCCGWFGLVAGSIMQAVQT